MTIEDRARDLHYSVTRGESYKLLFALPVASAGTWEWLSVKKGTDRAERMMSKKHAHYVRTVDPDITFEALVAIMAEAETKRTESIRKWTK
tara:strand:+ start:24626 stop:24898 length:273 start_codon:yes stop_codon:yes gene_type:complete